MDIRACSSSSICAIDYFERGVAAHFLKVYDVAIAWFEEALKFVHDNEALKVAIQEHLYAATLAHKLLLADIASRILAARSLVRENQYEAADAVYRKINSQRYQFCNDPLSSVLDTDSAELLRLEKEQANHS